jgi:hypothetical protein
MKDQVVMSKTNGQLAVAVPLYRHQVGDLLERLAGYTISISRDEPLAYILDCGKHGCQVLSARFVENNLEFLGDL